MGFLAGFSIETLVAPCDVGGFLEEFWDRRPLVENRRIPDFYDGFIDLQAIDRLVSSDSVEILRSGSNSSGRTPGEASSSARADKDVALNRLAQGSELVVRNLHLHQPELGRVCRILHAELGFACHCDLIVTLPVNRPKRPVAVPTAMFVLQLEGRRRWALGPERVADPGLSQNAVSAVIDEDKMEAVLGRGDLLYVPRGWPLRHLSTGDISVMLCIHVQSRTWLGVLEDEREAPGQIAAPGMADLLPARWPSLPSELLVRELSRRWPGGSDATAVRSAVDRMVEREVRRFPTDMTGRLAEMLRPNRIESTTVFAARPDLLWSISEDGPMVRLISGPLTLDVPGDMQRALEFCLTERRFTAELLPAPPDMGKRIALLERLVKFALVERISR